MGQGRVRHPPTLWPAARGGGECLYTVCARVRVCLCQGINSNHAPTTRFKNPAFLPLLQTISSLSCPAGGLLCWAMESWCTGVRCRQHTATPGPSNHTTKQQDTHCMRVCPTSPHSPAPCIPRDQGGGVHPLVCSSPMAYPGPHSVALWRHQRSEDLRPPQRTCKTSQMQKRRNEQTRRLQSRKIASKVAHERAFMTLPAGPEGAIQPTIV